MGEIINIESLLREENPRSNHIDIKIYADALRTYFEAAANVEKNGAICQHPRTGSPIENPYMKIVSQQSAILGRMSRIKSDRVVALIRRDYAERNDDHPADDDPGAEDQ